MTNPIDFSPIISAIESANNILVLPSSPPDGDSLGSALALYLALRKKGKSVTVICADPVPDAYKFLPDSQSIESDYNLGHDFIVTLDITETGFKNLQYDVKDNKVNIIIIPDHGALRPEHLAINQDSSKFDLIITVDTAELKQLGKVYESNLDLFSRVPLVNIDHHPSNQNFGQTNLVVAEKASTTLILTEFFQSYDSSLIDSDVATLLLAGIITDTGSFQNANTTPEAFDTAALLIGLGARQQEIIRHVYKTKELHTLRLWGRVLSNIQTDYEHNLVWSTVSQVDFTDTNSKESDIGDIIDELLSNAPEAEVVILFKELGDGTTHISIRTTTDAVNASRLAQNFGGGGHRRAAGANVAGTDFQTTVQNVLNYIRTEQTARLSSNNFTPQTPSDLPTNVVTEPVATIPKIQTPTETPPLPREEATVLTPQQTTPAPQVFEPEQPLVTQSEAVYTISPTPDTSTVAYAAPLEPHAPVTETQQPQQIEEPAPLPQTDLPQATEQDIQTFDLPLEQQATLDQPSITPDPATPAITPEPADNTAYLIEDTPQAPEQDDFTDTSAIDDYLAPTDEPAFTEEIQAEPQVIADQPQVEESGETNQQPPTPPKPEINFGDYLRRY